MRVFAVCVVASALGCAEPANAPPTRPAAPPTTAPTASSAPASGQLNAPIAPASSSPPTASSAASPADDAGSPETPLVAPTPASVALPGKCEDPHAVIRRAYGVAWRLPSTLVFDGADLDGDGVADIVYNGAATNLTHDVFLLVRRGSCAHPVGKLTTEAAGLAPASTKSHGLFDLEADEACPVDCCRTGFHFVFRFDGSATARSSESR